MVTPCLRAQSGLPSSVVNVLSFNAGGKCIKVEKEASPGADPLQAGELVRAWGEVTSGTRVECRLGQFIESQSLVSLPVPDRQHAGEGTRGEQEPATEAERLGLRWWVGGLSSLRPCACPCLA